MSTSETAVGSSPKASPIDALRDSSGAFTMVAIDQRGSLRHMYAQGQGMDRVDDALLESFKAEVAEILTPEASGILLDRQLGSTAASRSSCAVVLAADLLSSSVPGAPIDRSEIDFDVVRAVIDRMGARALKLLVPWLPETRLQALDLSHEFMSRCRSLGLPGVLEGVIRPRDPEHWPAERLSEALIQAAEDIGSTGPDLYKTEVVFGGEHDTEIAEETARAITHVVDCPWVVLSSGVAAADFPAAVAAAVRGGAEGFLAGRAIWGDALRSSDPSERLRLDGLATLRRLITVTRENRA
jgi:sulfofructosephosphate aldolase